MFSLADESEPPGPLCESTDLHDYLTRALFADVDEDACDEHEELFALWRADADIWNGGFAQFLFNASEFDLLDPIRGFRRVGLAPFADLFEQAYVAVGPMPPPPPGEERRRWLTTNLKIDAAEKRWDRALGPLLHPFDLQYYALKRQIEEQSADGFVRPICEYIESRREAFFPAP